MFADLLLCSSSSSSFFLPSSSYSSPFFFAPLLCTLDSSLQELCVLSLSCPQAYSAFISELHDTTTLPISLWVSYSVPLIPRFHVSFLPILLLVCWTCTTRIFWDFPLNWVQVAAVEMFWIFGNCLHLVMII